MNESEAIEAAWKIHAAIGDWTTKADAKATFALTIETALVGITVAFANSGHLSGLQGALTVLGGATLVFAIVASAVVVYPSLRANAMKAETPAHFIYFGHIKHMDEAQVLNQLRSDQLLAALVHQLKATADIAWTKHRNVQVSLVAAGIGSTLVGVAVLVT